MDKETSNINIKFGWFWLLIGIFEAAWMGMHAFQPDWLGGYLSLSRRFLRLSHIAFMALAIINIIYGLCLSSVHIPHCIKKIGVYSMILAAIFMPVICILCIFKFSFQPLFFLPVTFFTIAVVIMLIGQLKRRVQE